MVTPAPPLPTAMESFTSSSSTNGKNYGVADIPELAATLAQPNIDGAKVFEVVQAFRRILSVENNVPVKEVLDSGVLPAFIQMLSCHDSPDVQFEAAWALTNIASTNYTGVVAEAGAVPVLTALLSHPRADVREQSGWCLGNIAGDSVVLRDMVIAAGGMQSLIQNIVSPANNSLLNNCVWALSNCCRAKPSPPTNVVACAVPVLAKVLANTSCDQDAKTDALWALSYISDGDDERISTVVDCVGLLPMLIDLLGSNATNIITPALRTVGNVVSGNDKQTQAALDAGLISKVPGLLQSSKRTIRKEACWVLSNIAAGTQAQIQAVFKAGLIHVIELAMNGEWEVRKEAIWTLSNIATIGTPSQVMSVVEVGAIDALCSVLNVNDTKILIVALDAIESILKVGDAQNKDYTSFVDECDGLLAIEELQEHESEEVYEKTVNIIESYFGVDNDFEEENLAPENDGNMFAFGVPQKNLDASFDTTAAPMQFNF